MATAAAAVASRLACSHIEDEMSRGDEWLCSPPPPPRLATPDASDRPLVEIVHLFYDHDDERDRGQQ